MKTTLRVFLTAIICFSSLMPAYAEPPGDWKAMEVEAKWMASKNACERIISELRDGGNNFGYAFRIRWSGIPKKYVDFYYDTKNGTLSSDLHSLRHRTRYTSKPLAANRSLSTLINASWSKDRERIQYKSTPRRIGAIWFRKEVGDCRIWDGRNAALCPNLSTAEANKIITNSEIIHEALAFLRAQDHPKINR